jgi:hypothetical protein
MVLMSRVFQWKTVDSASIDFTSKGHLKKTYLLRSNFSISTVEASIQLQYNYRRFSSSQTSKETKKMFNKQYIYINVGKIGK